MPLFLVTFDGGGHFLIGCQYGAGVDCGLLGILGIGHFDIGPDAAALEQRCGQIRSEIQHPVVEYIKGLGRVAALRSGARGQAERREAFGASCAEIISRRFQPLAFGIYVRPLGQQIDRQPGRNRLKYQFWRKLLADKVIHIVGVSADKHGQLSLDRRQLALALWQAGLDIAKFLAHLIQLERRHQPAAIAILGLFQPVTQHVDDLGSESDLVARIHYVKIACDGFGEHREAHRLQIGGGGNSIGPSCPGIIAQLAPDIELVGKGEA